MYINRAAICHRESTYDKDGTWNLHFSMANRINYSMEANFFSLIDGMRHVSMKTQRPLCVLMSGGIDSELWANIVRDLKHRNPHMPDPVFVSYELLDDKDDLINGHDLEYARKWASDNPDMKWKTVDFRVCEFWESPWFWNYLRAYKCTSPQLPMHAYFALEQNANGYTVVLPEMQPELKRLQDGRVFYEEKEKDFSVVNCLRMSQIPIWESPLQRPTMMYWLLRDLQDFLTRTEQDTAEYKLEQYKRWFGYEMEDRPKYHGFEGYEDLDNGMRERIYDRFGYDDERLWIPYQLLMKNLVSGDTTYSKNTEGVIHYVREGYQPI